MHLPLISHPATNDSDNEYPQEQLTSSGSLRLEAHSSIVTSRAGQLFGFDDNRLDYLKVAAGLHDFGKITPQFQAYVRPEENYDGPDEEKAHARLGALATWYVLGQLSAPPRDRLAATLAVARHHQALPNAAQYTAEPLSRAFESGETAIQAQLEAIDEQWPAAAESHLQQSENSNVQWEDFRKWAESGDAASELRECSARKTLSGQQPDSSELPANLYDRTLHYWAALTLADKSHAMAVDDSRLFDLQTLDKATLEEYIADLRESPPENEQEARLNDERERARRQAVRGVHEWLDQSDTDIATLTLPTGLGKTFTGLSAAFEARNILDERISTGPKNPRPIVYALPYTSIIEQTRAIFEDPELWGANPKQSALTVHHYLSETVVYSDEHAVTDVDETDADERAELLGEAWRDGTILTTFVQLFESLTGPSNRQGLKLPALDGGLVILDEPQALPKDWWDAIERLLSVLTDEYGTRAIAMTATQPSLVRNLETTSLLAAGKTHDIETCNACQSNPAYETRLQAAPQEEYFETADRVRYTIDDTALSHKLDEPDDYVDYVEAAKRLHEESKTADSVLAICNTIDSSRELTRAVCEQGDATHLGPLIEDHLTQLGDGVLNQGVDPDTVAERVLIDASVESGGAGSNEGVGEFDGANGAGALVLTLNSRYRPFDRQVLIKLAEHLTNGSRPFIMVSTQAIEAGVDISFESVYRDIAPLDSIVQAAGRCNRSYEWGEDGGRVIIWTLGPASDDSTEPPAYWVYERGATDAGIPDHLRLISSVLADVPGQQDIPDYELSKRAVDAYFEALTGDGEGPTMGKSLDSGELRERIDCADARWLARQSLIGGYETVDVLVALTAREQEHLDRLTTMFQNENPVAYDRLQGLSALRVSVPLDVIEECPSIARIDGRDRGEDGVQVYRYTDAKGLTYELESGGLQPKEDSVAGRFTVL